MNLLLSIIAQRRRFDPDAADYFSRIVAAGSTIPEANKSAVNAFIVGCKADGIWGAIKASCILAASDTLAGALVPLVGTAPTNVGPFASGDYSRTAGLKGNGSTKYLNSNRNNNTDPQNNQHLAVWVSTAQSAGLGVYIGAPSTAANGASQIGYNTATTETFFRSRTATARNATGSAVTGLHGVSRGSSTSFTSRLSQTSTVTSSTSTAPGADSISVFARSGSNLSDARLSFYSIGESLDLALLDARLTALMAAIS